MKFLRRDVDPRHFVARFGRLRVDKPAFQVARRVLEGSSAQCQATANMRQVRADVAIGRGSRNGMAAFASCPEERLFPESQLRCCWFRGQRLSSRYPLLKVRGR